MLFNSLKYIIFLVITFSMYWCLPDRFRNAVLILASCVFYLFGGPLFFAILLLVVILSYFAGIAIETSGSDRKKKVLFICSLAMILTNLTVFKYSGFIIRSFEKLFSLLGFTFTNREYSLILPLGISFYTFQVLGYLSDVYRERINAEHNICVYSLFIIFFPHILSGPIGRGGKLIPQFRSTDRSFDYDTVMSGAQQILCGYFKKLVIADNLSVYVDKVYGNLSSYHGFSLLVIVFFYAIQIYCDFSGYSDVAIGSAKLFGIDLGINFRTPFFSSGIREFWSRWHISLSTWLRDYVYIPLGGSRKGKYRAYLNLLITFLASGLWHGADWTFIIWGLSHGILQIVERIIDSAIGDRKPNVFRRVLRIAETFLLFSFLQVPFRANTIRDALYYFSNMFAGAGNPGLYISSGLTELVIGRRMLCCILFFWLIPLTLYDIAAYRTDSEGFECINRLPGPAKWLIFIFIGFSIVMFSLKGVPAEFVYLQF